MRRCGLRACCSVLSFAALIEEDENPNTATPQPPPAVRHAPCPIVLPHWRQVIAAHPPPRRWPFGLRHGDILLDQRPLAPAVALSWLAHRGVHLTPAQVSAATTVTVTVARDVLLYPASSIAALRAPAAPAGAPAAPLLLWDGGAGGTLDSTIGEWRPALDAIAAVAALDPPAEELVGADIGALAAERCWVPAAAVPRCVAPSRPPAVVPVEVRALAIGLDAARAAAKDEDACAPGTAALLDALTAPGSPAAAHHYCALTGRPLSLSPVGEREGAAPEAAKAVLRLGIDGVRCWIPCAGPADPSIAASGPRFEPGFGDDTPVITLFHNSAALCVPAGPLLSRLPPAPPCAEAVCAPSAAGPDRPEWVPIDRDVSALRVNFAAAGPSPLGLLVDIAVARALRVPGFSPSSDDVPVTYVELSTPVPCVSAAHVIPKRRR